MSNEQVRLQITLSRIDDIEWSAKIYDHDYWCDAYAEKIILDDGTIVSDKDAEKLESLFPDYFMEKYIDFLY